MFPLHTWKKIDLYWIINRKCKTNEINSFFCSLIEYSLSRSYLTYRDIRLENTKSSVIDNIHINDGEFFGGNNR